MTQKGSDSINRVSKTCGDHEIQAQVGQSVHQKCRRDFCRPKKSTSKIIEEQPARGRCSVKPRFNTKEHCFFCGQPAKNDGRKRGNDVIPVRTQDFQDSIAQICKERNDEWSEIVLGRLEYAQDLHAADAVYHQACSVNFRTGKQVPLQHCSDDGSDKDTKRPRDKLRRQANKPALADAIWRITKNSQTGGPTGNVHFVLDGGALLHRVPWPHGITYDAICSLYVQYVANKYGKATVVFDGYQNGPSTKDGTHQRRAGAYGPTVNFDSTMIAKLKKEEFLANKENNQKFIHLLGNKLQQSGCSTIHAEGDVDLLIVQTAIQPSRSITTVLVGVDTDLLVLLCHHAEMSSSSNLSPSKGRRQGRLGI